MSWTVGTVKGDWEGNNLKVIAQEMATHYSEYSAPNITQIHFYDGHSEIYVNKLGLFEFADKINNLIDDNRDFWKWNNS